MLAGPADVAIAKDGIVYFVESLNHRVRRITRDGIVETIAGGGPAGMGRGDYVDGPGLTARFELPKGIAIAPDGLLYIADTDNARIRRIDKDGTVVTVAGNNKFEIPFEDAPGLEARLSFVVGLAFGPDGSLYIADQPMSAIRRLGPDGIVTTVARGLHYPAGVAVCNGRLFVSDTSAHRVVEVHPDGSWRVIAGSGQPGLRDGPGASAEFWGPGRLACNGERLLVVDAGNSRIRAILGLGLK